MILNREGLLSRRTVDVSGTSALAGLPHSRLLFHTCDVTWTTVPTIRATAFKGNKKSRHIKKKGRRNPNVKSELVLSPTRIRGQSGLV